MVSQYGTFKELRKFLQVQKPSSAMMKLALMRTATGKEDPEIPLLQRISSLELPVSEIAAQIIAVTDTSKHQLFRGDCVNQAFMVELLQSNHYQGTPIIRKDLLGPRNCRSMDIRPVEICPLV